VTSDADRQQVMTITPLTVPEDAKLTDVARMMRDNAVGAVMVIRDGQIRGIVTDRDIVVRALAAGSDPDAVPIGEICTPDPATVQPDDDVDVDAVIELMRDRAVRRVPVVHQGKPVGIVSLGDLAVKRGDMPALADICAVPPDFPRAWEDGR
jgi:CBS domain-containing protein